MLFVCIVCGVSLVYHFYHFKTHQRIMGQRLVYDEEARHITFYNKYRDLVLSGILGANLHVEKLPAYCDGTHEENSIHDQGFRDICLSWKDLADLRIRYYEDGAVSCYDVSWISRSSDFLLEDCFDLGEASWYGMGLVYSQTWPINSHSVGKIPFLTGTVYDDQSLGPVLEPYWISSAGVSILVRENVPLHISMNAPVKQTDNYTDVLTDNRLCLYADYVNKPYRKESSYPHLDYTVCVASNIAEVHRAYIVNVSSPFPQPPPDNILTYPVWSVVPHHTGRNTSQDTIEGYIRSIISQGYKRSAFILDSVWQDIPGELSFNSTLYPDPKAMIANIKSLGFQMVLGVDPYVSYNSRAFLEAIDRDLLVHSGSVPGLTRWWTGDPGRSVLYNIAGVVDMFPRAQLWLSDRLQSLSKKLGVDSYYWVGGQIDMQPQFPSFRENFSSPNEYLLAMSELGANVSRVNIQQSGFRSQHVAGMIRIYGRESSWTGDNSLASVIPTILTLSILGYPYILTDVIGGNAYREQPSKELYIRWMELSAFLPTMHFSIPPDSFDTQTVQVAKSMIDLHSTYVAPLMRRVSAESMNTSLPIIRPLWMVAPEDPETYSIDDQFMIGNDVMVAPMLVEGGKERAIYFPRGMWVNKLHGNTIQGSKWVKSHPVPISKIAYFERKS